MVQRRTLDLLPEIFRTDTNRKFLAATLDQLIQEPNLIRTQGYVGRRVGPGVNPSDYYVTEPTTDRANYQLEPGVVFLKPDTNTVDDAITYPGIIDALRLQGSPTERQDRLFESEFYSWDPFIDFDKFNNYSQYYWLPNGPDSVQISTTAVPTSNSWDVTRNDNDYQFSSIAGIDPTITLARGGTYTFNLNQPGHNFWIQAAPGINGTMPQAPNISSRDVLGVSNNGEDLGTVTFTVPLKTAQNFYYTLADIGSVDLIATDLKFNDVNNVYVSEFLAKYPTGIDGITSLNNRTIVFTNTITDAESGGWQITTQYDPLVRTAGPDTLDALDGFPGSFDSLPYDQTADISLQSQRYSIWQIQYTPDNDGQYYMTLKAVQTVNNLSKFQVLFGTKYSSTQWYKNSSGFFEQIPLLTAIMDTLYYQDSTNPDIFGQIKLVDPNGNEPIKIDDIIGAKNYISPNGVPFINGLKIQFRGPTEPAQFQDQEFYVQGVGTGPGVESRVGFVDGEAYFGPFHIHNNQLVTGRVHDESTFQQYIYPTLIESIDNKGVGDPAYSPLPMQPQDNELILVGNGITLVPVKELVTPETYTRSATIPYDSTAYDSTSYDSSLNAPTVPDYITINRASQDRNPWSRSNRWFHIDVIRYAASFNNNTPVLDNTYRAKRPIIEFRANIRLWNFGTQSKRAVNIVDFNSTDAFSNIRGTAGYSTDGYNFIDGSLVVFAADTDSQVRDRIWEVRFIDPDDDPNSDQVIDFIPVTDAEALTNQTIVCLSGVKQQGLSYWFDGTQWVRAQQKVSVNQAPLFDVYDIDGYSLGNTARYPSSNFSGSKLFGYALGGTEITDEILGFSLKYLNINNVGDIVFSNYLYTDTFNYVDQGIGVTLPISFGYVHQFFDRVSFGNLIGWQTAVAENRSRQMFRFVTDGSPLVLDVPVLTTSPVPPLQVFVEGVFVDPSRYTFTVTDTQTIINFNANSIPTNGAVVEVEALSDVASQVAFYSVPLNLENNPLNANSNEFTLGTIRTHYESIVHNLKNVQGVANGANNTSNLGNIIPFGNIIVQNSSPLVAAGTFLRKQQFDIFGALKFNSQEYEKFKARLMDAVSKGDFINNTATEILDSVLLDLSLGKTQLNPFYWSDMIPSGSTYIETVYTYTQISTATFDTVQSYDFDQANFKGLLVFLNGRLLVLDYEYTVTNNVPTVTITAPLSVGDQIVIREYPETYGNFVPNTPTKLGLYPAYKPAIYLDDSYTEPSPVIRGHDGSITLAFNDIRDQVLLEFETRIFNNLKVSQSIPLVAQDVVPGQFRKTEFSSNEINNILVEDFLSWVGWNKLDYITQQYLPNNPWTYNYSQSSDCLNNEPLLGNWRGVYNYFYDTTAPNTRPWEMLGFSQQPNWWNTQYGPAPYTSGNRVLWDDLAAGYVRDPVAPYFIPKYARPHLTQTLPVNDQGELLNPLDTVVGNFDSTSFQRNWTFGDNGPVENAWRQSSSYPFAVMRMLALTKPAKFFSLFADRDRYRFDRTLHQWLWDSRYRLSTENSFDLYGNGKSMASYVPWIVDYNQQLGKDSTSTLAETLASIDVRLCWRLGAFSDKRYLKLYIERSTPTSQNAGLLLPDESYQLVLYANAPFSEATYSSVIIQAEENGWVVLGYDSINPYFEVFTSRNTGNWTVIDAGSSSVRVSLDYSNDIVLVPYGYRFTTRQSVCDFLVNYGRYLEAEGFTFEGKENGYIMNWNQMAREFLYWSNQAWAPGSLINLNPGATQLSATRPGAVAESINPPRIGNIILNQNRQPISAGDLVIDRFDNTFRVTSTSSDTINFMNLRFTSYEHIIVLDNVSIFADLIYDPITGARQSRIRASGWVSGDWNGTVNAPGFVLNLNNVHEWSPDAKYTKGEIVRFKDQYWVASTIIQPSQEFDFSLWVQSDYDQVMKGMLPNAATSSDLLQDSYGVYGANLERETDLFSYGLIGFRPREYMEQLNLDDVSQVNLYQQFLGTKGTTRSAEIFTFANLGKEIAQYDIHEYWAIQKSIYGANANRSYFELLLNESLLNGNPSLVQVIQPGESSPADQTVYVENIWKSSYKINSTDIMPTKLTTTQAEALPTAGYVNFNDVDFTAFDLNESESLNQVLDEIGVGSIVWVAKSNAYDWDVYRTQKVPGNVVQATDNLKGQALITFTAQHNLSPGDFVLIKYFNNNINGSYRVTAVPTIYTILISYAFVGAENSFEGEGVAFTFESARVAQASDIVDLGYAKDLGPGARVWVDNNGEDRWTVLEKSTPYVAIQNMEPLLPEDHAQFGFSVSQGFENISAMVGAPRYNSTGAINPNGAVYAFVKNDQNQYQEKVVITLNATNTVGYGNAVDIGNQSWAVVGASASHNNRGYATVIYNEIASNVFEQRQLLVAPDQEFDPIEFGYEVAISRDENWMFVGAPGASLHRPGGQVYVFGRVDTQLQTVTYYGDGNNRLFNWADHIVITNNEYGQFVVVVNNQIKVLNQDYLISGSNVLFIDPPAAGQSVIITRRTGVQLDQEIYTDVSPNSTSGYGVGSKFTINRVRGQYNVLMTSGGTDFQVGDTLTFLATSLGGGVSPANDLVITVTAVTLSGTISSYTESGSGVSNTVIFPLDPYLATATDIFSFTVTVNDQLYRPFIDYDFNSDSSLYSYDLVFVTVPPLGADIRVNAKSHYTFTDVLSVDGLPSGSRFGSSLSATTDGRQLIVGAPGTNDLQGTTYVYNRAVQRFQVTDSTVTTYTTLQPLLSPTFVTLNGVQLVNSELNIGGEFTVTGSNTINVTAPLQVGDIIEVDTNQWGLLQQIDSTSGDPDGEFGFDVDICSYNCSIFVGAPGDGSAAIQGGAVEFWQNQSRVFGVITADVANPTLVPGNYICVNNYYVECTGTSVSDLVDDINTASIPNVVATTKPNLEIAAVGGTKTYNIGNIYSDATSYTPVVYVDSTLQTYGVDYTYNNSTQTITFTVAPEGGKKITVVSGRLVISVKDNNAAPAFSKLIVLPGTGTLFTDLGLVDYTHIQTILSPVAQTYAYFGYSISVNEPPSSMVIGAPGGTAVKPTVFDNGDTYFDANSTVFFDSLEQSGVAYTYDYLPSANPSVTNPGRFVFGQQLFSSNLTSLDAFGSSVDARTGVIIVGYPGYDYNDSQSNYGQVAQFLNVNRQPAWQAIRLQQPTVDVNLLNSVFMYDQITGNPKEYFDFFDPLQGKLLGAVQSNIDYIGAVDPARYNSGKINNNGQRWGVGNIGQIWWDTSSVRFIDPNQDDEIYASRRWGQIFPGSTVDVYQWIQSDVPPAQYVGPGKVYSEESFVVASSLNSQGIFSSVYYYWVTGIDTVATTLGKTMSISTIANYIESPKSSGIPYIAPLNASTVAIYNGTSYISAQDTVLHVEYDRVANDDAVHVEYQLIPAGKPDGFLSDALFTKFVDSFAGCNAAGYSVPDPFLPPSERYGIFSRPRQSFFVNRFLALQNYLTYANDILTQYPIVEMRSFNLLNSSEPIPGAGTGAWDLKLATEVELTYQDLYAVPVGYNYLVESDASNAGLWTIYTVVELANAVRQLDLSRVQNYDTAQFWFTKDWYEPGFDPSTRVLIEVPNFTALQPLTATLPIGSVAKVTANAQGMWELYRYTGPATTSSIGSAEWVRIALQKGTIEFSNRLWDYSVGRYGFDIEVFDGQYFDQEPILETRKIIEAINREIFIGELLPFRNAALILMFNYILSEQHAPTWLTKTSLIDVQHTIRSLAPYQIYRQDNQDFVLNYIQEVKPYHTQIREFGLVYNGLDTYLGNVVDYDLPAYYDPEVKLFISPILDDNNSFNSYASEPSTDVTWTRWPFSQWFNNYKLSIEDVRVVAGGTGYTTAPEVIVTGESTTPAVMVARINTAGNVIDVIVVDPGAGYVTTPIIELVGGNGSGAKAVAVTGNQLVRSIYTTIKYDRYQYSTSIIPWEVGTVYSKDQLVRYDNRVWSANSSSTDTTEFDPSQWTLIPAGSLTGVDRTAGYYVPQVDETGLDLTQLISGLSYPGVQVMGLNFNQNTGFDVGNFDINPFDNISYGPEGRPSYDPAILDAIYESEFVDSYLGTLPTSINVDGGEFIDTYSSHAPEELVPGAMFDTLDLRVYTTPGADWQGDGHGFPMASRNFVYDSDKEGQTFLYFGDLMQYPIQVMVFNITTGQMLLPVVDYNINWVEKIMQIDVGGIGIHVNNYDDVAVYVLGLGGGNQLHTQDYVGSSIGDTVVFPFEYNLIKEFAIFCNGVNVTNFTWSSYDTGYSTLITFATPFSATDRVTITAIGEMVDGTVDSWSTPVTQMIVADGSLTYTMDNYLGGTNVPNILVNVSGNRARPSENVQYYGDGSSSQYYLPIRGGYSQALISDNDVSVYIDNQALVLGVDFFVDAYIPGTNRTVTLTETPAIGSVVLISVRTMAQYHITGNTITFLPSKGLSPSAGEVITITTWNDTTEQDFLTQVFVGPESSGTEISEGYDTMYFDEASVNYTSGSYDYGVGVITQSNRFDTGRPQVNPDRLIVSLNGSYLYNNQGYIVDGSVVEILGPVVGPIDVVVITSLTQSVVPGEIAFRIFQDMNGVQTTYRIINAYTTKLVQPLSATDNIIYLENANHVGAPNLPQGVFGQLTINGERITYRNRDLETNTVSGLRRGVAGTGAADHSSGALVYDISAGNALPTEYQDQTLFSNALADGIETLFVAENISVGYIDSTELVEAVEVYVGGIKQTSGYTVTGADPVTVEFDTAPTAGYQVGIRVKDGLSWYEPGSGTASNGIPLQEQTTMAARFIRGH